MPPASPDSPNRDSTFHFVGRDNAVAQLRDSVRSLLAPPSVPPKPRSTPIFIAHGEHGMGKSSLLRRWREVAIAEGIPAERVIAIPTDEHTYPDIPELASLICAAIAARFPGFGRGFQAALTRRAALRDRYEELVEDWRSYLDLRDPGRIDDLRRAASQSLALAEARPTEESLIRLRSPDSFERATGRSPGSLEELLRHELGDADAALFIDERLWGAAELGADLRALAEDPAAPMPALVLAFDDYELIQHRDDWLLTMLLQAGDRVLALIGYRNYHRWTETLLDPDNSRGKLQAFDQPFDLDGEPLAAAEIRQLIGLVVERDPAKNESAEIARISRGVPLAVRLLAEQLRDNGDLSAYRDLRRARLSTTELVEAITSRFLRSALEEQPADPAGAAERQRDWLRIHALAVPIRPDAELLGALWGVDAGDVPRISRELRATHAFIFDSDKDYAMHKILRDTVRCNLKRRDLDGWPQISQGIERAVALLERRLDQWRADPPAARFANPAWRAATSDLINMLSLLRQLPPARRLVLENWIAARHYRPRMAFDLADLAVGIRPRESAWWSTVRVIGRSGTHPNQHRRNYQALERYLPELSDHARLLWVVGQGEQLEPEGGRPIESEEERAEVERAIEFYRQALELEPGWEPLAQMIARAYRSIGAYVGFKQKQWRRAIEYYDIAISFFSGDARSLSGRGGARAILGEYAAAITDFDRAIELDPANPTLFTHRGLAKDRAGEPLAAIADYDRAIELRPAYPRALTNRADIKARLADHAGALVDYDRAIEVDPTFARAFYGRADLHLTLGNYAAASADYGRIVEITRKEASAFNDRGKACSRSVPFTGAIDNFDHAIELDPDNASAFFNRGAIRSRLGHHAAAIADFDRAIQLDPDNAAAFFHRGYAYANLGDYAAAIADYDRAIELDREAYDAYINRGYAYANQGDYDESMDNFQSALDIINEFELDDYELCFHRGNAQAIMGDYREAIANYDYVIRHEPENARAFNNRGDSYAGLAEYEDAIYNYNRAIDLDPEYALAFVGRGKAHAGDGDHAAARADFDRAIDLDPDNAAAFFHRGNFHASRGDHAAARADFDRAIQLDPDNAAAFFHRGNFHASRGDHAAARADFNRAMALNPGYARSFVTHGDAHSGRGDEAAAIAAYDDALRLNPEDDIAFNNRGDSYANLGDYAAAIADFDRALQLDPEYVNALINRGKAYEKLGDYAAAIADYDRAIDLDPEDSDAYFERGNARESLGDYAAAIADYDQCIARAPDDADAYNNRGYAKMKLGDYAGARRDIERTMDLDPDDAGTFTSMAELLIAQGEYDEAFAWLRRAIALDPDERETIRDSADYDPVRSDPRFQKLISGG